MTNIIQLDRTKIVAQMRPRIVAQMRPRIVAQMRPRIEAQLRPKDQSCCPNKTQNCCPNVGQCHGEIFIAAQLNQNLTLNYYECSNNYPVHLFYIIYLPAYRLAQPPTRSRSAQHCVRTVICGQTIPSGNYL